jgi:hypothetical protein
VVEYRKDDKGSYSYFYFNDELISSDTPTKSIWYIDDSSGNSHYIGRNTAGTSYLTGFIYQTRIWNTAETSFPFTEITSCTGALWCDKCPDEPTDFCLLLCGKDEYLHTDAQGVETCVACAAACDSGCINGENCNPCNDQQCQDCTSFNTDATCTNCLPNTNDTTADCECAPGYSYFSRSNKCDSCYTNCSTCFDQKLYTCDSCQTGYH